MFNPFKKVEDIPVEVQPDKYYIPKDKIEVVYSLIDHAMRDLKNSNSNRSANLRLWQYLEKLFPGLDLMNEVYTLSTGKILKPYLSKDK